MNNTMQTINMLKSIKNPRQAVLTMANNSNNPMLKNLVEMAEKGDKKSIEQFARNVFKEQGRDFDKEYEELMKNFK